MKKVITTILSLVLIFTFAIGLTGCGGSDEAIQIAVPNDTTNEARALLLLQDNGIITLKDGAGITATIQDIADNPKNIEFKEVEAAQLPNVLQDVDYAVINSNYAISAELNPVEDSLAIEGSSSAYGNILAVKEGNENEPKIKALVAALQSKKVADFIDATYGGAVVSTVGNPGDGFDPDVDYAALKGTEITVAASPTPHAEILAVAKEILAEKDITLTVKEYTDYVQPNNVVESGEIDANYFQHIPYLESFNTEHGYHLVNAGGIHVEPIALYSSKYSSLSDLPNGAVIAIPNDPTNEGRALLLLQSAGLIKLRADAGLEAIPLDITENPKNFKFSEIEAATLPRVLSDVDAAIINGNYAIPAGLVATRDGLFVEGADSPYVNVIAVKEGNENNPAIKALIEALKSDEVAAFVAEKYKNGEVVLVD